MLKLRKLTTGDRLGRIAVMSFSKILLARYNPEEKGYVETGKLLVPGPRPLRLKRGGRYYFVSAEDGVTRAEIGWVANAPPFELSDFAGMVPCASCLDQAGWESFLAQIGRIEVDTPVVSALFQRSLPQPHMHLSFFKRLFYGR